MVFYERGVEAKSTESKINEINFDFAEKLKIEERTIDAGPSGESVRR